MAPAAELPLADLPSADRPRAGRPSVEQVLPGLTPGERACATRALLAGLAIGAAAALLLPAALLGLRAARHRVHLRRAREVLAEQRLPGWP
ncbi:hypothetical protein CFP65_4242 [Kitasatospora sp. MMS16-BH015]|uniref:hypothetical protein n=1 Tax=Kitasatospora sp. MMS16-BH015 TaxID=2018025 RepID=UPI000CA0C289|nr:hypothetical protein [Kitasatospora sp. MMS16-BH015]AUG78996.1 hypothetical protein CFP65_4242 [Kitasatospora sp. MMS16-BH015]